MENIRIAIAQMNTIVGDLNGNAIKIIHRIREANDRNADIVVFPELAVTGYPPEDLLLKPHFVERNICLLREIAASTPRIISVVGFVNKSKKGIHNSAAVIYRGRIIRAYDKVNLPNYGVFDEKRYFEPGNGNVLFIPRDFCFSVNICEDIWVSETAGARAIFNNSDLLINISSSPYHAGKMKERKDILSMKAKRYSSYIVYCNLTGGQDELVFDGQSCVFDAKGGLVFRAPAFTEGLYIMDIEIKRHKKRRDANMKTVKIPCGLKAKKEYIAPFVIPALDAVEEIYNALILGVRDYVRKNNFKKVVVGISGGIDSALVAAIASEAIGKENVIGISMPSMHSSKGTQDDAGRLAGNLGIEFFKVPISEIYNSYVSLLKPYFKGRRPDITEENLQARIRGNILMAFSNKFGYLVLNTGNKSETSVGYCTLYGDMVGGFSVIKDVPKTIIYKLARYKNEKERREIIPHSVFTRPPSAELRPGQKDRDSLPPYEVLDKIIDLYVEKDLSLSRIIKRIGNRDTVKKILEMIDKNEYKRRQAPPGIKITPRAFGKDRRMPITSKYREADYERRH